MSQKRRGLSSSFKARVALEALKEVDTVQGLAQRNGVRPSQVSAWKWQAADIVKAAFERGAGKRGEDHEATIRELHAKVGELMMEWGFFCEVWGDEPRGADGSGARWRACRSRDARKLHFQRAFIHRSTPYSRPRTVQRMRHTSAFMPVGI